MSGTVKTEQSDDYHMSSRALTPVGGSSSARVLPLDMLWLCWSPPGWN